MRSKTLKSVTFIILAALILSSFAAVPAKGAAKAYPDVPKSASYAKPVYWASQNGYVQGYKNGYFGPKDSCTRTQLVVILWRMAGKPAPISPGRSFKDVNSSMSSYKAIMWAVSSGIIKGYSDGTFSPDKSELLQLCRER